MITRIKLSSGNEFFYVPTTHKRLSYAFVVKGNQFIGGFLAKEADRKLKCFSRLKNVVIERSVDMVLPELDFTEYGKQLDCLTRKGLVKTEISDLTHADGGLSRAGTCCSRQYYYYAMGMNEAYNSKKRFPLWGLVANHLSIVGRGNFDDTFYQGNPEDTRYSQQSYQAPGYYLKHLVSQL